MLRRIPKVVCPISEPDGGSRLRGCRSDTVSNHHPKNIVEI